MPSTNAKWLEYEAALDEARRGHKPILLSLSAPWCAAEWDPLRPAAGHRGLTGQQALEDLCRQFVLARVDVERRPDVYRRYHPAEVPTALLLSPDGDLLLGAAPSGPGDPPMDGADGSRDAARSPQPMDLRATLAAIDSALLTSFDAVHGGFGVAPKYPEGYALAYALERFQRTGSQRWHDVFSVSLDGITRGLFDARAGGFYRSSGWRDWQVPSTAKLLGVNAEMIRVYTRAYEITQRTSYLEVATRSLQFVLAALKGPAFFGSVAPNSRLDRTVYLPPNEEMVGSLLLAAQVTGERAYAEVAGHVQRYLLEQMFDPERGFAHYHDGAPRLFGLLVDNAAGLVGLSRAYAALAERDYLTAAIRAAELVLRVFLANGQLSGLVIGPPPGLAFEDGALAAEGLFSLGRLTGSARYCRTARQLAGVLTADLAGRQAGVLARYGSLVQVMLEAEDGELQPLGPRAAPGDRQPPANGVPPGDGLSPGDGLPPGEGSAGR